MESKHGGLSGGTDLRKQNDYLGGCLLRAGLSVDSTFEQSHEAGQRSWGEQ